MTVETICENIQRRKVVICLQEVRKAKGLTRKELALIVGCSESMITKIERGEKTPSLAMAGKLSKALGKSIDRIFFAKNQNK